MKASGFELKPAHPEVISIIHGQGNASTIPGLMGLIQMFSEAGYPVELHAVDDNRFPRLQPIHGLQICPLPATRVKGLPPLLPNMFFWSRELHKVWKDYPRLCVIGIDPPGLILAASLARKSNAPLVYLSLELYVDADLKWRQRILKSIERYFSRKVRFAIVQDSTRAEILSLQNAISKDRILLLPNSSPGAAQRRKSDFLRTRLGIPSDRKIVLHAGSLAEWTQSLDLARSAQNWENDCVLVLHSREKIQNSALLSDLKATTRTNRVFLSLDPVDLEQLEEVIASADIGVALYDTTGGGLYGENLRSVGLSSGKIAQYLRCGKPVIASRLQTLEPVIAGYGCGVTVNSANEVSSAVERIMSSYNTYCAAAVRCYDSIFRPEKSFDRILRSIRVSDPDRYAEV
jgi:glycosyltransferase involved in cell wall biosynthesis